MRRVDPARVVLMSNVFCHRLLSCCVHGCHDLSKAHPGFRGGRAPTRARGPRAAPGPRRVAAPWDALRFGWSEGGGSPRSRADQIVEGTGERHPLSRRRADAPVDRCSGAGGPVSEPELVVFLDSDGAAAGGLLPVTASVVDEVACTGSVAMLDVSDPGRPLSRGRTTRLLPRMSGQAILHRDGGRCVVEGCTSRCRPQAHHVVPWSAGGPTDPGNLATLCWLHHHVVVHGMGHRIDPDSPPDRRRVLRPAGRRDPP